MSTGHNLLGKVHHSLVHALEGQEGVDVDVGWMKDKGQALVGVAQQEELEQIQVFYFSRCD